MIIVPKQFHLPAEEEKAIYDHHQNDPEDFGYRKFLSRTLDPLVGKLHQGAKGLDFGCGPGPAISKMGEEIGIKIENYDLYYYNDLELLDNKYDFIILTEVIEHIAQPKTLLALLDSMLKPNAILAVMTKQVIDQQRFKTWHYKNDLTHICFYSKMTFQWIAKKFGWQLDFIDKDVVFFYN